MSSSLRALRQIPAVEKVLQALGPVVLPRPAVVAVVRRELAALRAKPEGADFAAVVARVRAALERLRVARLQPIINGTGVILHTNLGRAPLAPAAIATLMRIAGDYHNLEFDLTAGERGARASYLEHNLALLCGAEAATVVNNGAAALVLILRHFAAGERNEVVISRGELVQIGGGFRIPEILAASGARLREVGTTNKTTIQDYAAAVGPRTALILKVHRSNFFMGGFVASPATEDLADLGHRRRVTLVEDLGSGAIVATESFGVSEHEPTPAEAIKRGVDLVCFSGDKLLGGPQAGVIGGKTRSILALKRNPLYRALRCDKLCLAALQTTVDLYLEGRISSETREAKRKAPAAGRRTACLPDLARDAVPVLQMMSVPLATLRARAEKLVATLAGLPVQASVGRSQAQVGGGTLPRSVIESVTLDLQASGLPPAKLGARLRAGAPPVVGYVSGGKLRLDLRTVFPKDDDALVGVIRAALQDATP
jgi:L-seryl-tRNA(Ser) seleniumtransferase